MIWVLKSVLVSLAIFVGTPIVLSIAIWVAMSASLPDSGPVDSTEPRRFTFLDRNFAIPVNYQPVLDVYIEGRPIGFWFTVLLPDFAPYSKARRDEWLAVGSGSPSAQISVRSLAMEPGELVQIQLLNAVDPNGQPAPHGLRRYDMQGYSTIHDIIYVPEQPTDVIFIGCITPEGEMMGCWMHTVYDHAARLQIAFDNHFLPDWREIAEGARRLIKSFEIQHIRI